MVFAAQTTSYDFSLFAQSLTMFSQLVESLIQLPRREACTAYKGQNPKPDLYPTCASNQGYGWCPGLCHKTYTGKGPCALMEGRARVQVADLKGCSSVLFFEARKKQDCYLWISKAPAGPCVKFHVANGVHHRAAQQLSMHITHETVPTWVVQQYSLALIMFKNCCCEIGYMY